MNRSSTKALVGNIVRISESSCRPVGFYTLWCCHMIGWMNMNMQVYRCSCFGYCLAAGLPLLSFPVGFLSRLAEAISNAAPLTLWWCLFLFRTVKMSYITQNGAPSPSCREGTLKQYPWRWIQMAEYHGAKGWKQYRTICTRDVVRGTGLISIKPDFTLRPRGIIS